MRVFLSFSSHDDAIAVALRDFLEARGITCWYAPRDVGSTQDYAVSITAAIESAAALVLVFSAHSDGSGHVNREMHLAADREIRFVPLRVDKSRPRKLRYFLSNVQWIEAQADRREAAFSEVATVLGTESGGLRLNAPFGRGLSWRMLEFAATSLCATATALALCGPALGSPWIPWHWRLPALLAVIVSSAVACSWMFVRSRRRFEVPMRGAAVAYFLGCAFGAAYWLADDKLIVRRVVDESTARNFIGESAKWRNDVPDQLMPVEGAVCLRREGDQLWIDVLVPPLSWLSVATLQFCRDTLEKENITAESVVAAEPVYFSQFQLPQHERDALRAAGALIALFYASACVILSLGHGVLLAATWRRLFPSVPLLRFRPHGDVENGTDATLVAPRSSGDAATKVS